jgi:hypothetical protein
LFRWKAKFAIFADALIQKCTDTQTLQNLNSQYRNQIYEAIMRDFLK